MSFSQVYSLYVLNRVYNFRPHGDNDMLATAKQETGSWCFFYGPILFDIAASQPISRSLGDFFTSSSYLAGGVCFSNQILNQLRTLSLKKKKSQLGIMQPQWQVYNKDIGFLIM